MLRVKVKMKSF